MTGLWERKSDIGLEEVGQTDFIISKMRPYTCLKVMRKAKRFSEAMSNSAEQRLEGRCEDRGALKVRLFLDYTLLAGSPFHNLATRHHNLHPLRTPR